MAMSLDSHVVDHGSRPGPGGLNSHRARVLARQTERDRETESEKSPPRGDGHASIPSPPFSSQDLGHTRTRAPCEFKPPGPGREP